MDNPDCCLCICTFLPDYDTVQFLSYCIRMDSLKPKVCFKEQHDYARIKDLPFFDNFLNIRVTDRLIPRFPLRIKSVEFTARFTSDYIDVVFPDSLETIDMRPIVWDSEFPKFPSTLKHLRLPQGTNDLNWEFYESRQSPFATLTNLESIQMASLQYHAFGKTLPKHITKITLYNANFLEKGDIGEHITEVEFTTFCNYSTDTVNDKIPQSVKKLKIRAYYSHCNFLPAFINRDMCLIVIQSQWEQIEKMQFGPDFRVEYFVYSNQNI